MTQAINQDDKLFDQQQAATFLRTSLANMQRMLRVRIGPKCVTVNGEVFYRRSALDAYAEERRTSPRGVRP
jgi:hypothetical protein